MLQKKVSWLLLTAVLLSWQSPGNGLSAAATNLDLFLHPKHWDYCYPYCRLAMLSSHITTICWLPGVFWALWYWCCVKKGSGWTKQWLPACRVTRGGRSNSWRLGMPRKRDANVKGQPEACNGFTMVHPFPLTPTLPTYSWWSSVLS